MAVCVAGYRVAYPRLFPDDLTKARRAYDQGDWTAAAGHARDVLKTRPTTLMPSAWSGEPRSDSAATSRRWPLTTAGSNGRDFQAEDYVLLGLPWSDWDSPTRPRGRGRPPLTPGPMPASSLEELTHHLLQSRRFEDAMRGAERLSREPGREARGLMMLGAVGALGNDIPVPWRRSASRSSRDPLEIARSGDPPTLGKLIARTFLQTSLPVEARRQIETILATVPIQKPPGSSAGRTFRREIFPRHATPSPGPGPTALSTRWNPSRARTWVRSGACGATQPSSRSPRPADTRRAITVETSSSRSLVPRPATRHR